MALPEITFDSPEEELKYGVKVLIEAGLSPQDIEKIRDRHKVFPLSAIFILCNRRLNDQMD